MRGIMGNAMGGGVSNRGRTLVPSDFTVKNSVRKKACEGGKALLLRLLFKNGSQRVKRGETLSKYGGGTRKMLSCHANGRQVKSS